MANIKQNMRKLGLVGLLGVVGIAGGCAREDVSRIESNVELTKPQECETVKDIRFSPGHPAYQLICLDKSENLVLYTRQTYEDSWTKITVKEKAKQDVNYPYKGETK